ncbi:helix-turn-helix domain-containing protein [Streptomyces sp. CA-249302]|uniref:helix-turn-helix domain-containing protein n=1 Tax=Streptomyces sp. CA-249302 TaxID=3240058 RepID=UPI003D9133E6
MRLTLGERVRAAAAALMRITGESQADLAAGLGVSQTQISRRQSGGAAWSLDDCEALAAHYGIDVLDLLAGPTRACDALAPQRRRAPHTAPGRHTAVPRRGRTAPADARGGAQ